MPFSVQNLVKKSKHGVPKEAFTSTHTLKSASETPQPAPWKDFLTKVPFKTKSKGFPGPEPLQPSARALGGAGVGRGVQGGCDWETSSPEEPGSLISKGSGLAPGLKTKPPLSCGENP